MTQRASTAPCALPGTPLANARSGIDACVHCGFCLQACPTYLTLDDENDSPRGRILLMKAALEGTIPLESETLTTHIDRCLGCRACETACPAGVPYGHLLEATRATMLAGRPLPFVARMVLAVFARKPLLALLMFGGRITRATGLASLLGRLPGRLGFAMAMLASTRRPAAGGRRASADRQTATSEQVVLLTGCVMEGLLTETNRATERVLARNGFVVDGDAAGQGCCGALHAHAGDRATAQRLARCNIEAFERANPDFICVNAAGCGSMMKEYPALFDDDAEWRTRATAVAARVRDVSELLVHAGPAPAGPLTIRATYDAPCHLIHAQRIASPPLVVLRSIQGLDLVPLDGTEHCCGAAGIYNLVEPEVSADVLAPKLRAIADTGAAVVATGNPGCMMQIGAGLLRAGSATRVRHPVELLDEAYAKGADVSFPA
jgi:glycolate oxidase iron-sulfur subunit